MVQYNKIRIEAEIASRFNGLRGLKSHDKFITELLDVYEDAQKAQKAPKEAPKQDKTTDESPVKENKPKTTTKRKAKTNKENSDAS